MKSNSKKIFTFFMFGLMTFFMFGLMAASAAEDPGEKILGFTLNNFDEQNNKTWDLNGETLDMFDDIIQLTPVTANVYGDDNMVLVADTGTFDRTSGKVHLQDNVVITSESGAKLTTDSLDWFQKDELVTTEDKVSIYKDNMEMEGVGAVGRTDLQQFSLNKDVQVDINPKEEQDDGMKKTTITCDGPLDIDYEKGVAVFNDNVEAFDGESQLFADKMTGYFDSATKKMVKVIAEGNVKIVRGENTAYGKKAIYDAKNQKMSLSGRPKLIIYSQKKEEEEEIKVETK